MAALTEPDELPSMRLHHGQKRPYPAAGRMGGAMRHVTGGGWRSGRLGDVGHALSLLAVLCQLLGILLLPVSAMAGTPDPLPSIPGVICHSGGDEDPAQGQPPSHHPSDCALCPICLVTSLHALGPTPAALPTPTSTPGVPLQPPTRAGPGVGAFRPTTQARAPPTPV